jgi:hypothetical protein
MNILTETYGYGIDEYRDGKWQHVCHRRGPYDEAIDTARALGTHAHVWCNGRCLYDTRPGETEPENAESLHASHK